LRGGRRTEKGGFGNRAAAPCKLWQTKPAALCSFYSRTHGRLGVRAKAGLPHGARHDAARSNRWDPDLTWACEPEAPMLPADLVWSCSEAWHPSRPAHNHKAQLGPDSLHTPRPKGSWVAILRACQAIDWPLRSRDRVSQGFPSRRTSSFFFFFFLYLFLLNKYQLIFINSCN
jgi:hypothetical protein